MAKIKEVEPGGTCPFVAESEDGSALLYQLSYFGNIIIITQLPSKMQDKINLDNIY